MSDAALTTSPLSGRTAWARNLETPLRQFLRTQTGSAAVLLAGAVAALVWANVDPGSYANVWHTHASVRVGGHVIVQDLRGWINTGLMTFFFFVVGLEARREFDMGELRERRRVTLPLVTGVCGMVVPVAIFLAFNAGHRSAHGWGVAMSTDTAFALGMLALVGRRFPDRTRAFMLTFSVVDDLLALLVIAFVYSTNVSSRWLAVAFGVMLVVLLADQGDVAYVWRHLPLNDVHPNAQNAAEASEAAAKQGMFWEMHDALLTQDDLRPPALVATARRLGLDDERFMDDLHEHTYAARIAEDVDSADLSNVSGTPTFFINGKRHYGAYDIEALTKAVEVARARAFLHDGAEAAPAAAR